MRLYGEILIGKANDGGGVSVDFDGKLFAERVRFLDNEAEFQELLKESGLSDEKITADAASKHRRDLAMAA